MGDSRAKFLMDESIRLSLDNSPLINICFTRGDREWFAAQPYSRLRKSTGWQEVLPMCPERSVTHVCWPDGSRREDPFYYFRLAACFGSFSRSRALIVGSISLAAASPAAMASVTFSRSKA